MAINNILPTRLPNKTNKKKVRLTLSPRLPRKPTRVILQRFRQRFLHIYLVSTSFKSCTLSMRISLHKSPGLLRSSYTTDRQALQKHLASGAVFITKTLGHNTNESKHTYIHACMYACMPPPEHGHYQGNSDNDPDLNVKTHTKPKHYITQYTDNPSTNERRIHGRNPPPTYTYIYITKKAIRQKQMTPQPEVLSRNLLLTPTL